MKVFAPAPVGVCKVILVTNIAETSITLHGIRYVIDPGFVKARTYDPNKGMEMLDVVPESKAQALQRSGRAGRVRVIGNVFVFIPRGNLRSWRIQPNLSNVILQLKALRIDDIVGFDFIDKPSRGAIMKALAELHFLGALTDDCKLLVKPAGEQMSWLPLDPVYSRALILAKEEMLITVAMLSVEDDSEKFELI